MSEFHNALVIVNPVSGLAQGMRTGQRLCKRLADRGIACSLRETRGEGDATRWSSAAGAEGFDLVVAIGGDGTVRESAAGLVRAEVKVPLAHVPVGTANVIAIALSLPFLTRQAAAVIGQGRVEPFDIGYLPELKRYFLLMAAIGYPARVILDSPRRWKSLFGVFTYLVAGVRNLFLPGDARVEIDTEYAPMVLRAHTLLITNIGRIQQVRFQVAPGTSPHDGKFDVSVICSRSIWDLLNVLLRLITWRHKTRALRNLRAERVRLTADPPLPVQIDGEIMGATPLTAEVLPGAIEIVVPASYRVGEM